MGPSGFQHQRLLGTVAAGWMISTMLVASALADSLWDHNGSVMRLKEQGGQVEIFYEVPRAGMVEQGVRRGQLFFNGRRDGSKVIGIARAFLRRCPAPMEYAIRGTMDANRMIVLKGRRPVFKDCRPQKTLKDDELVFIFLSNELEADAAASGSTTDSDNATGLSWIDELLRLHQPRQ